ncbi:MAG: DNA polymerase I [Andreesenia angusta]|nr:DNA polymerase I [Andreesenia angusta]
MSDKKKLMVIDGNSLLYRAFFALPPLSTKDGIVTNGVYGFLKIYYRLIKDYSPEYISIVFDKKGQTFRHEQFEEYKAGRAKMPDDLGPQFLILKEILKAMNIKTLEMDRYEADDLAGTLSKIAEEEGIKTILVSGDRDYLQLVSENTEVIINKKGISDIETYDLEKIDEEFGLTPEQLIDLKGLMGDNSDNIPGVPGIGIKTGLKLLKKYGSLESVYENIDDMKESKMKQNLIEYRQQAIMSKTIARIVLNVPLDIDIEELKIKNPNEEELLEKFKEYELKSLYEDISGEDMDEDEAIEDMNIDIEIIKSIEDLKEIVSDFEEEIYIKGMYEEDGLCIGLGILNKEKFYYLDFTFNLIYKGLDKDEVYAILKEKLEDSNIKKSGYKIKEEILEFKYHGIEMNNLDYDASIALYMANASLGDYSIQNIAREKLNRNIPSETDILGKGRKKKKYSDLKIEDRADILANHINIAKSSEALLKKEIELSDMSELFYDIEMPLTEVLADMEYRGFKIDLDELDKLDKEISEKLDILTSVIHELAGEDFNINSPKQLSEILFEKLELPIIKKTKTGYSTNIEVLEKLKDKHPIINKIIEYRQTSKLKSTYIDGLRNMINSKTGRIHSKFNQTITTTGRISSTEPNLQNIPIRTEEGRKIRKLFVAKDQNHKLVDADYSQIELRVLAFISGDEKLKSAFFEREDIHRKTASEVFNLPMDQVSSEMRSRAKAVNFGIIYGISDFGLARDLNIGVYEAKEYIESYLKNYPKVKEYMDNIVEFGKENGYVETILHRRRYIPELKSRNFNIRGFGERIALNTPIQGSAADIIKLAMIDVYRELKNRKLKSKLILQIHDELIVEALEDELEEVKEVLKSTMENAVDIDIPLEVDMKTGDSWYETK